MHAVLAVKEAVLDALCCLCLMLFSPVSVSVCTHSKEISKSNVVDDMVASNSILYEPGEHPDHTVVIK
jgi:hypothetical protein